MGVLRVGPGSFGGRGEEGDAKGQLGGVREPATVGGVEELAIVEAQRRGLGEEEAQAEADVARHVHLGLVAVELGDRRADRADAEGEVGVEVGELVRQEADLAVDGATQEVGAAEPLQLLRELDEVLFPKSGILALVSSSPPS